MQPVKPGAFCLAARPGEGQQPHLLAAQESHDGCDLVLPPNERCQLNGEDVRATIVGPERWKISRKTSDHHLVEMYSLLQVLEMVFPEITQAHAFR